MIFQKSAGGTIRLLIILFQGTLPCKSLGFTSLCNISIPFLLQLIFYGWQWFIQVWNGVHLLLLWRFRFVFVEAIGFRSKNLFVSIQLQVDNIHVSFVLNRGSTSLNPFLNILFLRHNFKSSMINGVFIVTRNRFLNTCSCWIHIIFYCF